MDDSDDVSPIYFVEYMFENSDGRKMVHGRLMLRGFQKVLGTSANKREVFLTNDCLVFDLGNLKQTVVMDIRLTPWGYQHRKTNANNDKIDRARAEERRRGLPLEYYCRSLYWPERGTFFFLSKKLSILLKILSTSAPIILQLMARPWIPQRVGKMRGSNLLLFAMYWRSNSPSRTSWLTLNLPSLK